MRPSITYAEKVPPEFLYHGTATRFLASILKEGIKPGERKYVHLSSDIKTAISIGQRHGKPAVLNIKSLKMHKNGLKFYQTDSDTWLTEKVPLLFLDYRFIE
ncbi:RNA 2'-phosphotransferase [Xanthomonas oryzae]|uniref:RNA 2'-phosphotransferase n=1 Tax=Xanthomonas oryzae TaxID=347 RepID=UPI0031F32BD0